MRLISDDSNLISTILSGFLSFLTTDRKTDFFALNTPLLCPDGEIIRNLSSPPSSELKQAWQKQIERSAVDQLLLSKPGKGITITPALTALAIVTYNFLKLHAPVMPEEGKKAVLDYNLQLCHAIAPAENPFVGIIYDSLIEPCCHLWRKNPPKTTAENRFLAALLWTNPLSELKNIDLFLPIPLKNLTGSYLVHQAENKESHDQTKPDATAKNNYQQWWLQAENFILTPSLKKLLRDQWLSIPENSLSCMGLGIFLEELRRRGKKQFRTPILEFFEAYDYLQRYQAQKEGTVCSYKKLTIIRHLLESKNREHNQKGNEYFLKFRALLEIVAAEQAIPREFLHLSRKLCLQHLAPLSTLATIIGGERITLAPSFGAIQFSD
ncbi:MAG: hypothetical protein U9N63_07455 [Pseudomonadota bacterium]|nr:hypothetical protein [Pseudomonadota bacterium]